MRSRNRALALYLQPAPLFGGAERQAATSAALLPGCGVDVIPVVGPGHSILAWLEERGVKNVIHSQDFPGGWPKQRGLSRLTLPFRYVACGLRLRAHLFRLIREENVSIIIASLPFAWIVGSLVARRARIPIIWRAGGAHINPVQVVALWLVTRFLQPDGLLCASEAVKRTISPLVPAPARVILNGVDTERFNPGAGNPSRYRPEGARWVIGYAARLTRAKRPLDVIELAVRLRERFPDARFLLAGEGSHRAELEARAKQADLNNVHFAGFVQEMPSFYAACDLVVAPSQSEGCPNFLLEAMAMGKPIVAADVAPVLELLKPGEHGLIYPLGNIHALAENVAMLLQKPEARTRLGLRARARALELTAEKNARKLASLLKGLLHPGTHRAFVNLFEECPESGPILTPRPEAE